MVREQKKREKERQIFGAMERRMKGKAKGVEKSSEKIGRENNRRYVKHEEMRRNGLKD